MSEINTKKLLILIEITSSEFLQVSSKFSIDCVLRAYAKKSKKKKIKPEGIISIWLFFLL